MARDLRIELRKGSGDTEVSPETVDLEVLADVLLGLRRAIAATAKGSPSVARASDAARVKPSPEKIALVSVESGSCIPTLRVEGVRFVAAGAEVLHAIEARDISRLPREGAEWVKKAFAGPLTRRWEILIQRGEWGTKRDVVVSDLHPLPELPPIKASSVEGTTTLYGTCVQMGGANKPRVLIQPLGGGRAVRVFATREELKELEALGRLYRTVALEGKATWKIDGEGVHLDTFHLGRILEYRTGPIGEALGELREVIGDAYDHAEAFEMLDDLRLDE